MKEVLLNMNEQQKYDVIKELVDHGGNKKRAALKLGITVRQVNRLIQRYKEKGKAGFVHGNKTRKPINSLPEELNKKIVDLYERKYQGWNFQHFREWLKKAEDIDVSYTSVYSILTKAGYNSPQIQKATRKKRAKEKARLDHPDLEEEELEEAANHVMAIEDSHPTRPRKINFGEQIQMDASEYYWFGESKSQLHLSIDDATGTITGGWFDKQETLNAYYHVLEQILKNYGIPYEILTDNRTVFNYETHKTKTENKDVLTQFGYACKTLGVTLNTTSVSQAKGRVERANGTVQRRLANELALAGITTMEEANDYLINIFIPEFNRHFALAIDKDKVVFADSPTDEQINLTLAVLADRTFNNGSTISYKNKTLQAYDGNDELVCFSKKTKCLVINAFDGQKFIAVDEKVYAAKEVEKHETHSENFDEKPKEKKKRKIYIPPMSHPWKHASYMRYQERAHNYHIYS